MWQQVVTGHTSLEELAMWAEGADRLKHQELDGAATLNFLAVNSPDAFRRILLGPPKPVDVVKVVSTAVALFQPPTS